MQSASRTLVMSPPELWELIDQPDRMQGLMCGLIGRATEVTVNERRPESMLRWEASEDGAGAWIEVQLAEKGWGTNVKLRAENGGEPTKLEGWLDAVLDELATPQKRPFEGREAPPEPVAPAPAPKPVVEPEPELEPEPQPVAEAPQSEPEPVKALESEPSKLRRFFGLSR
jgi:hypothetical protein